ncbi:protein-glutamine gamma-glutamyltransferase 6 [Pseudoliparis swirei]|uniref:protein-glutamine gamma-glutamyltransferase 6 n=1 Tax=Pseudoliparis swirei TaxID=2059687 RepID=UPI0024BEB697|nr:protein-glutamine gamma-glutamyltransferase 6 [Pseudoliparis swirei]
MTEQSLFNRVDLHCETNNGSHHTDDISVKELIVRRGQPFKLTLDLKRPFDLKRDSLTIRAATGEHPTKEQGTLSIFSLPERTDQHPSAKAVWKVELQGHVSKVTGLMSLRITPPAAGPIGEFNLTEVLGDKNNPLAKLVVLYNPWCPDDWVYMKDVEEINEYVLNENGVIYKGSNNYIIPLDWDFGQFEYKMVEISLKILDLNHKHLLDPADDVAARCNPIYVGRVVSAMINSQDDSGVLMGRWDGSYDFGFQPSHWSGSHAILKHWLNNFCRRVKYGQCWVFAGVMCSVMRLLGVPCRVVSNFQSAHDNNKNLIIDMFHADYGVRERPSPDSVWNFHVWVEAWMRRPDLDEDGKYDGWQVLDPTPQEKSEGIYCCGPTSVTSILNGQTDLRYDIPFVYAEVNADCIDWLVKADGTKKKIYSDTKRVGQNISTKAVGSNKRIDITSSYKHKEGSDKERSVFQYARTRDYSDKAVAVESEDDDDKDGETEGDEEWNEGADGNVDVEELVDGEEDEESDEESDTESDDEDEVSGGSGPRGSALPEPDPVHMHFEEVTPPTNGKAVRLKLVMQSISTVDRQLAVSIRVKSMRYNGSPAVEIKSKMKEKTLLAGKDLFVPIRVRFRDYHKSMKGCDSMKFLAVVTDMEMPDNIYMTENDVVLLDPPITINLRKWARLHRRVLGEVVFRNPVNETLTDCSLTLSGSGLMHDELKVQLPDLKKNSQFRVKFPLVPYKLGRKTLIVDFDCAIFRDIKGSCTIKIRK